MRYSCLTIVFVLIIFSVFSQTTKSARIINIKNQYGLVDEVGNTILSPIYDTVYSSISNHEELLGRAVLNLTPVFIFKKDNKFGFAYQVGLDTLSNFKILPEQDKYWKIEEPIYDSINKGIYGLDYYSDTTTGFDRKPYYVFKFKLNGKWGMFYIRGVNAYSRRSVATVWQPAFLGQLEIVKPIYDEIGMLIWYSLYNVKLNGKWTFLQVLYEPKGYGMNYTYDDNNRLKEIKTIPLTWIEKSFYDNFDTIPMLISNREHESGYFKVKKDNKWGAVKFDKNGTLDYIMPCIYDSIDREYAPMVAYTDSSTVLYDYNRNNKNIELPIVINKDYKKFTWRRLFKQYYIFEFLSPETVSECRVDNMGLMRMEEVNSYLIFVVDTNINQIVRSYKNTQNVWYERVIVDYHWYKNSEWNYSTENNYTPSCIIRKIVKTGNEYKEYFIDLETEEIVFELNRGNEIENGECYFVNEDRFESKISIHKKVRRKKGEDKSKYVGCYDFKTKTYTKGKCKE